MYMKDQGTTKFKLQNHIIDNIFNDFKNLYVEDEWKMYR